MEFFLLFIYNNFIFHLIIWVPKSFFLNFMHKTISRLETYSFCFSKACLKIFNIVVLKRKNGAAILNLNLNKSKKWKGFVATDNMKSESKNNKQWSAAGKMRLRFRPTQTHKRTCLMFMCGLKSSSHFSSDLHFHNMCVHLRGIAVKASN